MHSYAKVTWKAQIYNRASAKLSSRELEYEFDAQQNHTAGQKNVITAQQENFV